MAKENEPKKNQKQKQENSEKRKAYMKQYRTVHKKDSEEYRNNPEHKAKQQTLYKQWYQKNKVEILNKYTKKIMCECCHKEISAVNMPKHIKTDKHLLKEALMKKEAKE
jgi:hypothetical protein